MTLFRSIHVYTLLCLKRITNKDLLYSTLNFAQCCVAIWMGEGIWGRMDIGICMAESLCSSPETVRTLLMGYTPIENKKFKRKNMEKRQSVYPLHFPRPDFFPGGDEQSHLWGLQRLSPRSSGWEMLAWGGGHQHASCRRHSKACQVAGGRLRLSCTCPDSLPMMPGPLFVSQASRHRFQTSQETASFHFQLCQMGLLCNQTCLSPRIDPKAPSNLMTFPHALLSLASCLGWWAALPHPDVSWGLELCRESPRLNCCRSSQGPGGRPLWQHLSFSCTTAAVPWHLGPGRKFMGPSTLKKWDANNNNGVCPTGQGQGFKAGECWTSHPEGTPNKLSLTPNLARSAKDTWKEP